ncbi:MAG TPA: hemolysin III family protein [Planctomycetota bacterium]|nr:hemolysin III family protein [Planctomycetota bacterium]
MQVHALPGLFEPVGALTHLAGSVVFACLSVGLVRRARGDARRVLMLAVYACACVLLLALSGAYHMLPEGGASRELLGRLDLSAIFVLIAGTQTPVHGLFFRGLARWGSLTAIWLCAAVGATCFTIYYDRLPPSLSVTVFLLLGWAGCGAAVAVWRRLGTRRVALLLLGGLAFTLGAVVLILDRPVLVPGVVGPHELWHLAVLAGMGLHWAFLYRVADHAVDG